jgi:hypothetical protein
MKHLRVEPGRRTLTGFVIERDNRVAGLGGPDGQDGVVQWGAGKSRAPAGAGARGHTVR